MSADSRPSFSIATLKDRFFRRGGRSSDNQAGQSPQTGNILYRRTGSYAHITQLEETVSTRIMNAARMEHDIIVLDSKTSSQVSRPSSDTLALKGTAFPSLPTSFRTGPFAFYELFHDVKNEVKVGGDVNVGIVEPGGSFELRVNDAEIEKSVQERSYTGVTEYRDNYIRLLDRTVRLGVAEALFREKLGLSGHSREYLPYLFTIGMGEAMAGLESSSLAIAIGAYLFTNIYANRDRWEFGLEFYQDRSVLGALFLPIFPIDHFVKGVSVLARNRLVVATQDS